MPLKHNSAQLAGLKFGKLGMAEFDEMRVE